MMIGRRLLLIVAIFAVVPISAFAKVPGREPLTLTYLGNAGWQIEDGHTVIIVDPYVSQFHDKRMGNPNTSDDIDEVLVPDEAQIAAHIARADFLVITHSHSDHMLDAPSVAKGTGAVIIGSEGSANIEREMTGLNPDIALIGSGASRKEIYRYSSRLMKALDDPAIVLPTHWDSYASATVEKSRDEVQAFSAEIKVASPHTKVIVPEYFKPMTFN
jgi:hypothetical protein